MSQQVATTERTSVTALMAERYNMDVAAFEATVRETCSPKGQGSRPLTKPEFGAFMVVANEYGLNPLTKEIYAFPAKGGGIVPVLSIDGWVSLVNGHKQCDGFEFDMEHDAEGKLVACTCKMYRKDRSRPVVVTEYLSECKRNTEPWKMEHRMLRHKAMIQAARYAFGFSGIYDEDEGKTIAEMRDVTPPQPPVPPTPPQPPREREPEPSAQQAERPVHEPQDVTDVDPETGEISDPKPQAEPEPEASLSEEPKDDETGWDRARRLAGEGKPKDFLDMIENSVGYCGTVEELEQLWFDEDVAATLTHDPNALGIANGFKLARKQRLLK